MKNANEKIQELLRIAEKENKKSNIPPRKFRHTEDGKLILDPNKEFDRKWYKDDEDYDLL